MLDFLIPRRCISCKIPIAKGEGDICGDCWAKINFIINPLCQKCGTPFPFAIEQNFPCDLCRLPLQNVDILRSVVTYDEHSQRLVRALKFADKTYLAKSFGSMMRRVGGELIEEADIIVPIPLHKYRLLTRKYNQASLLAASLGRDEKVIYDLLKRIKYTKPQTRLDGEDRLENIKGIFAVRDKYGIEGKKILLIDDVMTTGATMEEAAKTLKEAGAAKIYALTFSMTRRFSY